ncbi:MAG: hypothetical protein GTN62_00285 [Gemmatimonadales bacterium]|nr:hypothetical protein [Gemmatimonadales bacterium]NIN48546.1 hypothetical protein [Gemmatimonadales bacterium]NIP06010.1 hypothetical protein [Gemmatimonadales bacterium]NIS65202.1 hypothetical protein [Gemmatimonadales bacterium]
MSIPRGFCIIPAALVASVTVAGAQAQVPTFQDVAGHAFGERITQHHEMVAYLDRADLPSQLVRDG